MAIEYATKEKLDKLKKEVEEQRRYKEQTEAEGYETESEQEDHRLRGRPSTPRPASSRLAAAGPSTFGSAFETPSP